MRMWCSSPRSQAVYGCALVSVQHRRHGGRTSNEGQANRTEPLLAALQGDAYGGPVGLAVYFLARGEIEQAVEWSAKATEQRFPAFIPRMIRAFEPSLRRSAAWADLASGAGYFDRAHFGHEFREFTGLTPTRYVEVRQQFLREHPGHTLDGWPLPAD